MQEFIVRQCKTLVFLVFVALFILFNKMLVDNQFHNTVPSKLQMPFASNTEPITVEKTNLKYILQWTSSRKVPFVYMGVGQKGFIDKKCLYTNCFVTDDQNYLGDITKFDAIAFLGTELARFSAVTRLSARFPLRRTQRQKYVFATIESAANYPICSKIFDGYFNWTWTYRLDSDSRWGYVVVRDVNRTIIGPNKVMHWLKLEDMLPVPENLKQILHGKTKAAAWFVSNCNTPSKREIYAGKLQKVLGTKYNLTLDIYGNCGKLKCPRNDEEKCHEMLRRDYYFYLAFENSFSEDYVTEKLVHALGYNALPIVYGGANYSRFLPEGSFLNAAEMDVEQLAGKMNELIHDFDKYAEYFRWTNHYNYHRRAKSVETDDYCGMCKLLNDESKVKETKVYKDFRSWWNSPNHCKNN